MEQRLRAVQIAASHLRQAAVAEAADVLLRTDSPAVLNSAGYGAWVQATLLYLDRATSAKDEEGLAASLCSSVDTLGLQLADEARLLSSANIPDAAQPGLHAKDSSPIDVVSLAARIRLPGIQRNHCVPSVDLPQVAGTFHDALSLVHDCLPWVAVDRARLTPIIVPTVVENGRLLSATNSELLGAVFISAHDEPALVAEQLVHEVSHTRLFLMQMIDDLLDERVPNESWEDARFYSPWRHDPRPLNGIFHGAFVFDLVAEFWRQVLLRRNFGSKVERIARRRLGHVVGQLQLAHMTLERHGRFTAPGTAIVQHLRLRLANTLIPLVEEQRLHSERAFDIDNVNADGTSRTVAQHLQHHAACWHAEFGHLAS